MEKDQIKTKTEYSDLVLYSYWRASCPWRVRLALNLKQIPYKIIPVNLLKQEHDKEDYLKLNLHGRVPTLEFSVNTVNASNGDIIKSERRYLHESTAIIDFLEEAFPDKFPLYPKGEDSLLERCKIKAIAQHIACNIHPIQNLNVLSKVESLGHDKIEWARHFINCGLSSLEQDLKEFKGKYCYGDSITLADIYVYPQLYFFKRNNLSLDEFPLIKKVQKNLSEHPAFVDAEPENQIDALK
jgi:maleylacetoacetate isomerase